MCLINKAETIDTNCWWQVNSHYGLLTPIGVNNKPLVTTDTDWYDYGFADQDVVYSVGNQIGVGKESGLFTSCVYVCLSINFVICFSENRFVYCCRCIRLSICIKTAQVAKASKVQGELSWYFER